MTRPYYPTGNALQRAIGSLRQEGPAVFAYKLASELGYRRLILFERMLNEPIVEVDVDLPVDIGVLDTGEVDAYVAFESGMDRASLNERLANSQRCFVVRHEGSIVSACWAATLPCRTEYLAREIPLAEGDVYLTRAYTSPAMRGHSLAHALCVRQLRYYRDAGFRRALRLTVPENAPAIRAHTKSGFRPVAMLGRIRIGWWRYDFRRDWPAS